MRNEPVNEKRFVTGVIFLLISATLLAVPVLIIEAVKAAWRKALKAWAWFVNVGLLWLIFIALCWHFVSAMAVNAIQGEAQYNAVKNGCIKLSEQYPKSFEWDGVACVHPESRE